jgi:hypothetical protein
MAEKGKELVELHLLKSESLERAPKEVKYCGESGTSEVKKIKYENDLIEGKVWINKDKYFLGVTPDVWEYQIGGYQVCHKYLKDRKRRIITSEERNTYAKIVKAIERTIEIQSEIDEMYDAVEEAVVEV